MQKVKPVLRHKRKIRAKKCISFDRQYNCVQINWFVKYGIDSHRFFFSWCLLNSLRICCWISCNKLKNFISQIVICAINVWAIIMECSLYIFDHYVPYSLNFLQVEQIVLKHVHFHHAAAYIPHNPCQIQSCIDAFVRLT